MLSIFKKRSADKIDFSIIGTDMHSHLLPGIDDGAPNVEVSLELISGLQDLGYKKFITTPHIMSGMYPNSPASITAAYSRLSAESGNTEIKPAAEYYLDEGFDVLLQNKEPLMCIHDRSVLIELSFASTPINYKERIFEMQLQGYQPVLAHPERYLYFAGSRTVYDDLKNAGCQFACNILSFTGYYGKIPVELSNYLFKKGYIDYLGTDAHHSRHIESLQKAHVVMPVIKQLADSGKLLNVGL